jgi:hypothetical protein
MSTFIQNDISRTVWPWQAAGSSDGKKETGFFRRLVIQVAVMTGIGWLFCCPLGHAVMGYIVWGAALIVLLSGLFFPPVFSGIERFGKRLGWGAAVGLTWLLLVPFFYIVFVPIRLISRLKGNDPLCRKFPTNLPTYWIARPPVKNVEHYRKQH